jgi:hypothetical protein
MYSAEGPWLDREGALAGNDFIIAERARRRLHFLPARRSLGRLVDFRQEAKRVDVRAVQRVHV